MRTVHPLAQGGDAWHQFRLEHNGASEAAAVLGLSKTTTRSELLRMKHTGIARKFSEWVQSHILDRGHEVEKLAIGHVEDMIDDALYPVTCSIGKLSASCDGLTLGNEIAWEHKQYAEALFASVKAGRVPEEHMPQCQQVLMVTGAGKLIFTVSDGTPERMAHAEVLPDPVWFERLRAGWAQFDKDLADYVPTEATTPVAAGKAPETLPALRIEVTGMVTASNLAEFKQTALTAIRAVNRDLTTDADFLDAAAAVKWCGDVEDRLEAAKQHALSQTASIDQLFRTIDDIGAEARAVRLELDKLVTRRKVEIKDGIVLKAKGAYEAHVEALRRECGIWTLIAAPDFPGAAKNKRTLASLQDAVDVALANGKISADAMAKSLREKLAALAADGAGYEFLFSDRPALVQKPLDDLKTIIAARIAEHKAKEAARIEAETARIRAEEQAKAQREAAAQAAAKVAADAAAARAANPPMPVAVPPAAVVAKPAPRIAPPEPATLNMGAICTRLGFTLTAAFVSESLGIQPAATDKQAKLFRESQFPAICEALVRHIAAVSELQAA